MKKVVYLILFLIMPIIGFAQKLHPSDYVNWGDGGGLQPEEEQVITYMFFAVIMAIIAIISSNISDKIEYKKPIIHTFLITLCFLCYIGIAIIVFPILCSKYFWMPLLLAALGFFIYYKFFDKEK